MKSLSNETSPEPRSASPTFAARTTLTVNGALGLYSMTDSESFWEIKQDTRCLIGWGNHTVVVAFRGTASMRNALADMQVTALAHPVLILVHKRIIQPASYWNLQKSLKGSQAVDFSSQLLQSALRH